MENIVSPELELYIEQHTRARPPLFDELREVTYSTMASPNMQVGRVEGGFLKMLVAISGARRVLEIGTFTGYSALCMAEALPDDGELHTLDIDPEATQVARSFFDRSPHGKKITLHLGDALGTLPRFSQDKPFDLVFIDADKERYSAYFDAVLPLLREGGLLVADNTLWSGRVLSPSHASDHAIIAFNKLVNADPRVENVLLSIRDGMMLARKVSAR